MLITEGERTQRETSRLGELYERYAPGASRLAYLLTGDRRLAEDLMQEAFVRVFGRFRDVRDPNSFEAYLRRTVVNLANSHFRRARTEREWLAQQPTFERTHDDPDPTERDAMWNVLQILPQQQRAAIVLRFYEDLSERQIADALRCPVGTVKSLLSRGLVRLRDEVTDDA